MEGAILSTQSNNRFRTHLKNAATALCARTLPKSRCNEQLGSTRNHHTYPRSSPTKRPSIPCRMEPLMCDFSQTTSFKPVESLNSEPVTQNASRSWDVPKLKGNLAREVASAWECRIGPPDQPAPAHRVQSLFNDIELYPTKTQVFEMLVCARQCARRKSLTLTFGEFCVFAAELRRCSRQTRQTSNKPESPVWSLEKEFRDKDTICKHINGSEASPPPCEVFLGGSCNPTTWRSDIAIPMLKKMGITYFNPQVDDWSSELIEVENRAKAKARALLFVLDSETRTVGASVEAAHLAASPHDLLLVLRPYSRHQTIGNETISDQEYIELSRARATLQEAVERRGFPTFPDIPAALRCARAVLRGARTHPRQSLGHTILRLKRAFDAAGGRNANLPRARAVEALKEATRSPKDIVERCLPPNTNAIDFETFCAAVAELVADTEYQSRASEAEVGADAGAGTISGADRVSGSHENNGLRGPNPRLRAHGQKFSLFIPKNGGNRNSGEEGVVSGDSSGDSVFSPETERRLDRLPVMLGAPVHDVYLGGSFPSSGKRPEQILRRAGLTYVVARANDYSRMFSAPARRAAPAHPESPRTDKKPRPAPSADSHPATSGLTSAAACDTSPATSTSSPAPTPAAACETDVELRERPRDDERVADRLSASDFYTVTEDITPQPFKGTYDEELLLRSRALVFAMSAEAPCFAAMVLAAHYMGLRPGDTVLLVQPMDPAYPHKYSAAAVKDYNRGRMYLKDLALRSGVTVVDTVDAAMAAVMQRLRAHPQHPQHTPQHVQHPPQHTQHAQHSPHQPE